jgi:hypothetical protein
MINENPLTNADLDTLKNDLQNFMGSLYEKFHSDVELIIENQQETNHRIDTLENKNDLIMETVGEIKVELSEIHENLLGKVDQEDHRSLEKRISRLEIATS